MSDARIYLASRSPRRRELLKQIGVNFELLLLRESPGRGTDVDETPLPGEAPHDFVLRVTRLKAETAWMRFNERRLPRVLQRLPLLAADTAVVLGREILSKPSGAEHAVQMLRGLSGRTHQVLTAVAVIYDDQMELRLSESHVTFAPMSDAAIRHYVASGEPLDKAGAYAIQGRAAAFVSRIEGSFSGVMGLPLYETAELLRRFGCEVP
ncbi:MAG TPA: Maf family protein [Burkholderiales bacterium]|nr:Maf family protein [Burkholderiales bacterium]